MTSGISKEDLIRYKESAEKAGNLTAMLIIQDLIYKCKELYPWVPIDDAPKGERGFLAINKDRDSIEWLSDIGEDKFYNNNSNNFTDKSHWTHYKELPPDPK